MTRNQRKKYIKYVTSYQRTNDKKPFSQQNREITNLFQTYRGYSKPVATNKRLANFFDKPEIEQPEKVEILVFLMIILHLLTCSFYFFLGGAKSNSYLSSSFSWICVQFLSHLWWYFVAFLLKCLQKNRFSSENSLFSLTMQIPFLRLAYYLI